MSKFLLLAISACTLLGLISAPASAQDAESRAVGPVTAKSAAAITVGTGDKKNPTLTFVVNETTKVSRGRSPITIEAVEVGETAGVVGTQQNGQLVATLISVRPKN